MAGESGIVSFPEGRTHEGMGVSCREVNVLGREPTRGRGRAVVRTASLGDPQEGRSELR